MGRSRHQRHRFFHNKRLKQPHPYRHRKIKPYGLKGRCGYGGEFYRRKYGEIFVDLVNKKKYRRILKKELLSEIRNRENL